MAMNRSPQWKKIDLRPKSYDESSTQTTSTSTDFSTSLGDSSTKRNSQLHTPWWEWFILGLWIFIFVFAMEVYKDCEHALLVGDNSSTVYITPDYKKPFIVACDHEHFGGGWTIVHRRVSKEISFNRTWDEYKHGFGDLQTSYQMGNENLFRLTQHRSQCFYMIIKKENEECWILFKEFYILDEKNHYTLILRNVLGQNCGDEMSSHSGSKFTTKDKDNDENEKENCAKKHGSGFWYTFCGATKELHKGGVDGDWFQTNDGIDYSMPYSKIMVRHYRRNSVKGAVF